MIAAGSIDAAATNAELSRAALVHVFAGARVSVMPIAYRTCALVAAGGVAAKPVLAQQEVHLTLVNVRT